jgi:TP901 family phage tail tape measure protein
MSQNVGEVYAVLGLDKSSFESSLSAADSRFDSFGSSLASKAGSIAKTVGAALVIGTGALVAGLGAASVSFSQYEQSMADVAKIAGLSDEETKSYGKSLLDLSVQTGLTVTSLAGLEAGLASAGVAKDQLFATTQGTAIGAKALGLDPEAIATDFGKISNLYGLTGNDATKFFSMVNELENAGVATGQQILTGLSDMGALYVKAGGSVQQYAALQSASIGLGLKVTDVATGFNSALDQAAQNQKNVAEGAKLLHVSQAEYVNLLKTDGINTLFKLNNAMDKQYNSVDAVIGKQRMFGAVGSVNISLLSGKQEELTRNTDLTTKAFNEGTSAQIEFDKATSTNVGVYDKIIAGITKIGITIGEMTDGYLKDMLNFINDSVIPGIQSLVEAFAEGDWDSIGDIITEGLESAFESISEIGENVWEKIKDPAITAFKLIAGAAGAGLVVTSVVSFGPVLVKAGASFATMGLKGVAAFAKIAVSATASALISGFTSLIGYASKTAAAFFTMGVTAASSFVSAKLAAVSSFITMEAAALSAKLAFLSTWAAAVGPIAGVVAGIGLIAAGLGTLGYALNPGKFTEFNKVATDAFNGIKTVVSDCWSLIKEGDFSGVGTRLKTAFTDAANYVKEIDWKALGTDIINMVGDGANAVIESALNFGEWIREHIQAWIDNNGPENLGRDLGDALITGVKYIIDNTSSDSIWASVTKILGTVNDWLGLGLDIATGIGSGLYDAFKPYIAKVYNSIITFVRDSHTSLVGWKDQVSSTIGNVFDGVVKNIGTIKTFLSTKLTITLDTAWTLWETTVTTIKTCLDEILKFKLPSLDWSSWSSFEGFLVGLKTKIEKVYSAATGGTPSTDQSDNPTSNPTGWTTEGYDSSKVGVSSNSISNSINQAKLNDALSQLYNTKSTSTSSTKLKTMSIGDTVSNPSLVNPSATYSNGIVDRTGKELTSQQISSGTWSEGTLNQVKAALEQNSKSTIDNTVAKSESTSTTVEKTGEVIDKSMELIDYYDKWSGTTLQLTQSQIDVMKSYDNSFMVIEDTTKKINNDEKQTSQQIINQQQQTANKIAAIQLDSVGSFTNNLGITFGNAKTSWEAMGKNTLQSSLDFSNNIKGSSTEFTTSVNLSSAAVRYGLTDAGQKIAVIGSVAQQQYLAAGKQFIDDAKTGSGFTVSGAKEGNQFIVTGAKDSSKITVDSAKEFGGIVTTSANGLANSLSSFNINQVKNLAPDDSEWSHEYFDEITNSSYSKTKKANEEAEGTIKTASKEYSTTIKWTTDNLFTTWNGVLVRTDQANVQSSQNQISSSQTFATNVNNAANSNLATANTINSNSILTSQKNSMINDQMLANAGIKWTTVSDNVKSSISNMGTNLKTSVVESKDALCAAGDDVEESLGSGATALDGATENLNEASENLKECSISVATTASNIIGLANRGGGAVWGGTSISGGGGWVGTGSTNYGSYSTGYTDWGGTAASIYASNYRSGSIGSFRWGAKGYLADKGAEVVGLGEKGKELVLPSDITETILQLTRQGFKNDGSSQKVFINNPVFGNEQTSEFGMVNNSETSKNLKIDITFEMDGQQIARKIFPYVFKDVNRSGLKTKH